MTRSGGARHERARLNCPQALLRHLTTNPLPADFHASGAQFGADAARTILPRMLFENRCDLLGEIIFAARRARRARYQRALISHARQQDDCA